MLKQVMASCLISHNKSESRVRAQFLLNNDEFCYLNYETILSNQALE